MVWRTGPAWNELATPWARLSSPEVTAASWSPRASSMPWEAARRRPSADTTRAWRGPGGAGGRGPPPRQQQPVGRRRRLVGLVRPPSAVARGAVGRRGVVGRGAVDNPRRPLRHRATLPVRGPGHPRGRLRRARGGGLDPLGRGLEPFGQRRDPLGRGLDLLGQRGDPLGRLDPLGEWGAGRDR